MGEFDDVCGNGVIHDFSLPEKKRLKAGCGVPSFYRTLAAIPPKTFENYTGGSVVLIIRSSIACVASAGGMACTGCKGVSPPCKKVV